MVALQNLLNTTVETFDHTVGLGRLRRGQAMLDVQGGAERVELMFASRSTFAQAEEAIGELFSIISEYGADAHRAGAFQVTQEAPRIGRCLAVADTNKDPAGRSVDGHEEVTAAALIGHLWQVFHIDMDVAGLVGLERAVFWFDSLGFEIAQVADAMTSQAPVEARARGVRVQELADHGKQVVERYQQRLAQSHRDSFLRRCQRRLKPMRRMAAILDAVALAPFPYSLFSRPVAFRENPSWFIAGLYRRPDLRRRRCMAVKLDQHVALPSRASVRTQRAMKSADRRGAM